MSDRFPVLTDTGKNFITKDEQAASQTNYLPLEGGFIRGPIDMGGQRISEGIFSTASSGQRVEFKRTDRGKVDYYSGDEGEVGAGAVTSGVSGSGVARTLQTELRAPTISTAGGFALTVRSESFDDSTTPPGAVLSYTGDSVLTPEFKIADTLMGIHDGTAARPAVFFNNSFTTGIWSDNDSTFRVATSGIERFKIDASGNVNGTHGSYHVASDRRLKEHIEPIDDALEKVNQLEGVTYRFIDGDGRTMMGLIYQDVQPVVPEVAVKTDEYGAVEYAHLVPLLIEAVKTLTERVEELEAT